MEKILFSLSDTPPPGFLRSHPSKKDLLINGVGIHADSLEQAQESIKPLTKRINGVILTLGKKFSGANLGPNLWHVTFPQGMFHEIKDIAFYYLDIVLHNYNTAEELKNTQIEYGECKELLHSTRIGYNDAADKLISNIKEIKHLQKFLTDILNSMPSIIIGVDLDGTITHWNLRAEQETGKTSEEALGKNLQDVWKDSSNNELLIREAICSNTPKFLLQQKVEYQEKLRYLDIAIFPLSDQSAVVRADDVTEKVQMEEALIQSEKMQSIGTLTAGIAHEINNPLAAILQNLQVIDSRLSSQLKKNHTLAEECGTSLEAVRQYLQLRKILTMLERIQGAGHRASEHVNNMLSFSRQASEGKIPHDIKEVVNRTIEIARTDFSFGRNYDFKKINIVQQIAENVPSVVCDASKIQQVLLNLFTNSAYALMEKISLKNRDNEPPQIKISIDTLPPQNSIQIAVSDNGSGMDLPTSRRVFEPFFTTKGVGEGTGLGLSVCYYIITQQHNGELSVESEKNRGTTFYISLPLDA